MQQWQFFPALMKLARSGLSDIIENDFEVNVVDDTEVDIRVDLDNRMSFLLLWNQKSPKLLKADINLQRLTRRAYLHLQRS